MTALLDAIGLTAPGRLAPTDLSLRAGELTLLLGPNGSGKTSLLHALAGIGDARGEVRIGGREVRRTAPAGRAGLLFFSPAARELRWPLAGRDLVALGLNSVGKRAVEAALQAVDALAFADRPADRLSTGERARLMLARALAARPAALLLDEPVANLDPLWQLRTLALLRAEAERGAAVLASIHDIGLARAHGDRLLLMQDGRIVADGAPDQALDAAALARVFAVRQLPDGQLVPA